MKGRQIKSDRLKKKKNGRLIFIKGSRIPIKGWYISTKVLLRYKGIQIPIKCKEAYSKSRWILVKGKWIRQK